MPQVSLSFGGVIDGYISILLASYFMWSGALESCDLLQHHYHCA